MCSWDFVIADTELSLLGADFLYKFRFNVDVFGRRLIVPKSRTQMVGIPADIPSHGLSCYTGSSESAFHDILIK